MTYYTTNVHII